MFFYSSFSFVPMDCHTLHVFQASRRVSNDKKAAQRKSSGQNKGGTAAAAAAAANAAAAAPRKSSSSAAAPRESTSIGAIGPAVVGQDGGVQDVEQRVADVFVAFASSVAKVRETRAGMDAAGTVWSVGAGLRFDILFGGQPGAAWNCVHCKEAKIFL